MEKEAPNCRNNGDHMTECNDGPSPILQEIINHIKGKVYSTSTSVERVPKDVNVIIWRDNPWPYIVKNYSYTPYIEDLSERYQIPKQIISEINDIVIALGFVPGARYEVRNEALRTFWLEKCSDEEKKMYIDAFLAKNPSLETEMKFKLYLFNKLGNKEKNSVIETYLNANPDLISDDNLRDFIEEKKIKLKSKDFDSISPKEKDSIKVQYAMENLKNELADFVYTNDYVDLADDEKLDTQIKYLTSAGKDDLTQFWFEKSSNKEKDTYREKSIEHFDEFQGGSSVLKEEYYHEALEQFLDELKDLDIIKEISAKYKNGNSPKYKKDLKYGFFRISSHFDVNFSKFKTIEEFFKFMLDNEKFQQKLLGDRLLEAKKTNSGLPIDGEEGNDSFKFSEKDIIKDIGTIELDNGQEVGIHLRTIPGFSPTGFTYSIGIDTRDIDGSINRNTSFNLVSAFLREQDNGEVIPVIHTIQNSAHNIGKDKDGNIVFYNEGQSQPYLDAGITSLEGTEEKIGVINTLKRISGVDKFETLMVAGVCENIFASGDYDKIQITDENLWLLYHNTNRTSESVKDSVASMYDAVYDELIGLSGYKNELEALVKEKDKILKQYTGGKKIKQKDANRLSELEEKIPLLQSEIDKMQSTNNYKNRYVTREDIIRYFSINMKENIDSKFKGVLGKITGMENEKKVGDNKKQTLLGMIKDLEDIQKEINRVFNKSNFTDKMNSILTKLSSGDDTITEAQMTDEFIQFEMGLTRELRGIVDSGDKPVDLGKLDPKTRIEKSLNITNNRIPQEANELENWIRDNIIFYDLVNRVDNIIRNETNEEFKEYEIKIKELLLGMI